MERAILFRFHKEVDVCESRIRLLKELNPAVPIFGLGEDIEGVERLFDAGMEDLHVIDHHGSDWKWKNGDLAVKHWFSNTGKDFDFDMLHIVEWDLLFAEPLDKVYSGIKKDQVGLTGLKPISEAEERGWNWVTGENADEWEELKDFAADELGFSETSYGCIFAGACLPRTFLEEVSEIKIPALCNDEVRVPLVAEALGYELVETGFFGEWGDEQVHRYFNAKGQEIEEKKIQEQLSKPDGRRAFHPVRNKIGKEKLDRWKK